ncbi:MAG: hypothetical protein ACOCQ2_01070 [Halanaerobiales bacterium]
MTCKIYFKLCSVFCNLSLTPQVPMIPDKLIITGGIGVTKEIDEGFSVTIK